MSRSRLYMDSCCIIDAVKHAVGVPLSTDRLEDVWYVQQCLKAAEAKDIEVIISTLTVAECQRAEGPPTDEVKRLFRSILSSGRIVMLAELTPVIAEKARDLRWDYDINLKGADAVHVATALALGCMELFTTDDRGPIKNAGKIAALGLRVIRASQTRLLPSKYAELPLFKSPRT